MEFSFSEHIILENAAALLRPLEKEDFKELSGISYDYEIWRFNVSRCMNNDELISHINSMLEEKRRERIYPFIIIDKKKQLTAGSSSFSNAETGMVRMAAARAAVLVARRHSSPMGRTL